MPQAQRAPKGPQLYNAAIMEPRIQYTKTSDGIDIAFATVGKGPPLLWVSSTWASHLTENLRAVEAARYLAAHFTVIRYDGRGTGLSSRNWEGPSR